MGLVLLLLLLPIQSYGQTLQTIYLDGKLTDWGLEPVYQNTSRTDIWQIQEIYVGGTNGSLIFGLQYAALGDFKSLLGNITLRTPSDETYLIMYQYTFDNDWSYTGTLRALSLYNQSADPEFSGNGEFNEYTVGANITNLAAEFEIFFTDIGVKVGQTIDMVFWSVDSSQGYSPQDILIANYTVTEDVIIHHGNDTNKTTTDNQTEGTGFSGNLSFSSAFYVTFSVAVLAVFSDKRRRKN